MCLEFASLPLSPFLTLCLALFLDAPATPRLAPPQISLQPRFPRPSTRAAASARARARRFRFKVKHMFFGRDLIKRALSLVEILACAVYLIECSLNVHLIR